MVESKLTKVKVNNEIELCEVYDNATKERIKKVFFREGISFFIKFRKKFQVAGFAAVDLAGEITCCGCEANFIIYEKRGCVFQR